MEKAKGFLRKRKKEILVASITLLVVLGVSFAWLRQTVTSSNKNVLKAGKLQLTILNEDPIIRAGGEDGYAIPTYDYDGLITKPYTFTIKNTGTIDASFDITLVNANSYTETYTATDEYGYGTQGTREGTITYDSQRIPDSLIRFNISEGSYTNSTVTPLSSTTNRTILSGTIAPGVTKTYHLRLWIDINATVNDIDGKTFAANLSINAIQSGGRAQQQTPATTVYMRNVGASTFTSTTIGSAIPNGTTTYNSLTEASPSFNMAIKNVVRNGVVEESYLSFMGGGQERSVRGGVPSAYSSNVEILTSACTGSPVGMSAYYGDSSCVTKLCSGYEVSVCSSGEVGVYIATNYYLRITSSGTTVNTMPNSD